MDLRLYILACIIAISSSCLQLDANSNSIFDNCPTTSGPSMLNLMDDKNAGVERLVVYFYKAKKSSHIVPFIPSREYQECFQDIAIEKGKVMYSTLNTDTIRRLFKRSSYRTMRYRKSEAQAWDVNQQNYGSHDLDETHNTGETGHYIPIDDPDHDNEPPNHEPEVDGNNSDKRHPSVVNKSPKNINPQPWDVNQQNDGSHELDETHNKGQTGHKVPIDDPDHDNDSPNHEPEVDDNNPDHASVVNESPENIDAQPWDVNQQNDRSHELDEAHDNGETGHSVPIDDPDQDNDSPNHEPEDDNNNPDHASVVNESPENIDAQPGDVNLQNDRSHELDETHNTGQTGHNIQIDDPEHGNDSANHEPEVDNNNPDKRHPSDANKSHENIDAQPWDVNQQNNGSHELDETHNNGETGHSVPIDDLDQDNESPNHKPVVDDNNSDKGHPSVVNESPENNEEQPWDVKQQNDGSHELHETHDTGETGHNIPIDDPDHDNESPNHAPEVDDNDPDHTSVVNESPKNIDAQSWDVNQPSNGSHELNETHNTGETSHDIPVDDPDHSNDSPNHNSVVDDNNSDKRHPSVVNGSPKNIVAQPWDVNQQNDGSHELDNKGETGHNVPIDDPDHGTDLPNHAPVVDDNNSVKKQDLPVTIQESNRKMNDSPGDINYSTTANLDSDILIQRPDGEEKMDLYVNILKSQRPYDILRPINENIKIPIIKPGEYLIKLINPDELHPVIRPKENNIMVDPFGSNDQIGEKNEAPVIRPILNNIFTRPHQPDKNIRPIIRDYTKGKFISPKPGQFSYLTNTDEIQNQSNSEDLSEDNDSKEVNGQLNIDDGNVKSDESSNSEELNNHAHKYYYEPSEKRYQLKSVYKWRKVRVPRVDSHGNVYGWIWKTVTSPVRSKSIKNWSSSYYESRGKKHSSTHWKRKSVSSKTYHQTSNGDVSAVNFDAWVKKQIGNMQNNENKTPASDHYISTVKVAIEKALRANGIRVASGGVLIDAEGNVLRLDNIQLRPIYVGRSVSYDRIVTNSDRAKHYRIPASTSFLEGLLVSMISPPRSLGVVPLGITTLPLVTSPQGYNVFAGPEKGLRPISVQDGLNKLITGQISGVDDISSGVQPNIVVDDGKALSEEEPEYRIIGGSFAMGSGAPLTNKGRSGLDSGTNEAQEQMKINNLRRNYNTVRRTGT